MRRQQLIVVIVVLVVAAALFSVYQFYLKGKLEAYSKDQERLKSLETRLDGLAKVFSGVQPETIVGLWEGAEQPWRDAVKDRARFFNLEKQLSIEDIPEEGIVKFYYEEQLTQRLNDLRQEAYNQGVWPIPLTTFGVPSVEQLKNRAPTKEEVLGWLNQLERGCAVTRMLVKARPLQITRIELWPTYSQSDVLRSFTIGIELRMTLENLVRFFDKLNRDPDRYYCINEVQIRNRQLQSYQDPPLEVAILLTEAVYVEPAPESRSALAALGVEQMGAAAGGPGGGNPFDALRMEKGDERLRRRKGKSWFRKYFWPFDWP